MKKEKVQSPRFIEVMPKGLTPTYVQPIRFYLKGEKVVGTDKNLRRIYKIEN